MLVKINNNNWQIFKNKSKWIKPTILIMKILAIKFDFILLFNGLSTFMGYLKTKPSLKKDSGGNI